MNVAVLVDDLQPLKDLVGQKASLPFLQQFAPDHSAQSGAAVLHKQHNIIFPLLVKVQFNDIGVVEKIEHPDLILNPPVFLLKHSLINFLLTNNFQRVDLLFIFNNPHLAKSFLLGYVFDILHLRPPVFAVLWYPNVVYGVGVHLL